MKDKQPSVFTRILGTGSYLPRNVVTNEDLSKKLDTSHEWIFSRTGIEQRHIADEDETNTFMSVQAAEKAIAMAGISKDEIDLILVATNTPDMVLPNTATLIQEQLQCHGIPAFDLVVACAGFVYGLSIADQFIRTGTYRNVLLIGVESMSSIVDWKDRATCVLFGDGAGAAILQASDSPGIIGSKLHADGRFKNALYARTSLPNRRKPDLSPYVNMIGPEVFKLAVKALGEVVDEILAEHQMHAEQIDWLIPHQANFRIIQATAKKLNMSLEKVILTVHKHANTSAASVILALDEGIRTGKIQRGQTLLLEAIGGSFVWGANLLTY